MCPYQCEDAKPRFINLSAKRHVNFLYWDTAELRSFECVTFKFGFLFGVAFVKQCRCEHTCAILTSLLREKVSRF